MTKNHIRLASIGYGLMALVVLGAAPAQALDFSGLTLVYQEDFEAEAGFPTLPEVNVLLVGDVSPIGIDGLNSPIALPGISGGAVIGSIHSEVPQSFQSVQIPSTFVDSFAMRATFDSFSVGMAPSDGGGATAVSAAFGTFPNPTSIVEGGISISTVAGSSTAFVYLSYTEAPAAPVNSFVALSMPATTAILGGASFTVDMMYDKDTMIATGSADIAGIGVITAPPLDISAVAGISSSTPVAATAIFLTETFGLDADVRMEDVSIFLPGPPPATLIGDQIQIGLGSIAGGSLQSDLVTVVQASVELSCPGAFDLCNASIPGTSQGSFDIESTSLTLNVGPAGGSVMFAVDSFNGYTFSDLDLGVPITSVALKTDIPGLTVANVAIFGNSVLVDLSGLTVDPGQSFTVELNPTTSPPSVPMLSGWGVLMLLGTLFASARRWLSSTDHDYPVLTPTIRH